MELDKNFQDNLISPKGPEEDIDVEEDFSIFIKNTLSRLTTRS
jgi:hypothetical protein